MKYAKQILMALCCILFTVNASATSVTKDNAAKVAKNYFSEVIIPNGTSPSTVISESFDIKKDGNTVLYVFNFEKGGYVIVSAEDRFTPILGYSPDGYYDQNNMPDGFKFLLEEFADMIAFIREKDLAAEPEYPERWERLAGDNPMDRGTMMVIVEPMTALWNQDFPYNYYAPTEDGGPGGRAYAGCVATAMSIIMYYWRWPWQGTGEKTYTPKVCNGTVFPPLTANFEETYYDYNGMYGTTDITADNYLYEPIALLQYHAGIAVSMGYCKDGSGAFSADVPAAMRNYFKYDPSIVQTQKGSYTTIQWGDLLKEQLDLGQPVYVSGQSPSGGHAFVCDGYNMETSGDMFHYNFGWSGSSNGYFVADKPLAYTSSVAMVRNFIPDRSKCYPADCNGNWTIAHLKGMLADGSEPIANYQKGVNATWLLDPSTTGNVIESFTITCNEIDIASGDYLEFFDGENENAPSLGQFTGRSAFEKITSTGGKVLVKFTSAANSATGKGFLITYEATAVKYCDKEEPFTFREPNGKFTDGSPDDMKYPNNANCKWFVDPWAGDPDTEILFKFLRLDTEEGSDLIKFYNADNNKLEATVSGNYAPDSLPQVTIKAKKAMITFVANSYVNDKGFEVEYVVTPTPAINEVENIKELSIYPNPATDKLNVKFNTSTTDDFNITIYNVTGQEVYKEKLNNFVGSYYNEININDFAQGVYLMQIKSSKGAVTQKVVVQ